MIFLMIAVSVSLDSLLTGIVFGIKGVRVSLFHYLFICVLFMFYCLLGHFFSLGLLFATGHVPYMKELLKILGNVSLLLIGLYLIHEDRKAKSSHQKSLELLNEPALSDLDNSGSIDVFEAVFLTLALSVDTVLAVFSLSITGEKGLETSLLFGIVQSLFMLVGLAFGKAFSGTGLGKKISAIKTYPGYILIIVGILRLFST